MSEVMTCMPFEQLMNWVLEEKKTKGTVFGQHRAYACLLYTSPSPRDCS